MEDIGLWIPLSVYHIEHDDKPENAPEGYFRYTIRVAWIMLSYVLSAIKCCQTVSSVKCKRFSLVHLGTLNNVLFIVANAAEEEIIPGPPLSPECNAEVHTDYGGTAVRWGLTHHKESAADCCQACIDQAKRARPGALKCNIWVYCPSEYGCFSPDKYEHKHQECWLKQVCPGCHLCMYS